MQFVNAHKVKAIEIVFVIVEIPVVMIVLYSINNNYSVVLIVAC